jgi:hypothetical protein
MLGVNIKTLDYKGEEYEKLTDQDVRTLKKALLKNSVFEGPLDLSRNDLTDLVNIISKLKF